MNGQLFMFLYQRIARTDFFNVFIIKDCMNGLLSIVLYQRIPVHEHERLTFNQGSIFWSKTDIYSPPPLGNLYFFPKKTA